MNSFNASEFNPFSDEGSLEQPSSVGSADSSLDSILKSAKERLIDFSSSDAAVDQMVHLFENAKVADVEYLLSSWASGDFSTLPIFAVLDDASMHGAWGAFAAKSNTVYLSDRLAQQNATQQLDPITGAVGVAIEEIGHSVDELLNPAGDTAGDEGALFKTAVLGLVLSGEERVAITQENDQGTIVVSNEIVAVEQAVRRDSNNSNTIKGTRYRDYLYGRGGNDKLYGYGGDDKLYGGTGNDRVYGGSGSDYLSGWSGDDYLSGWSGNDRVYGGSGDDRVYGGSGNDRLYGNSGEDRLSGSSGDDRLYGSSGDDILYGGSGNDKLYGGTDDDYLSGYTGNDYLSGWSGNDTLKAYGGGTNERDILRGGSGNDTFLLGDVDGAYYTNSSNSDYATLRDLSTSGDKVQLHKFNNTVHSTARAYGYRLEVQGDDTWLRRDNDGQAIALIEGQTNLSLLSDTFSYVGKADLSFGSASASPTVYTNGQLQLAINVENDGVVAAETQNMRYWLSDDAKLDTATDWQLLGHSSSGISAGTSRNFNWNIAYNTAWGTGKKYVFFQIDNGDVVEESNESNNIISQQITLSAPRPDIIIQNQSAPSSVIAGNTVSIGAYTKNNGSAAASGSHNIRYWLSNDTTLNTSTDRYLGSDTVGPLTAGSREYDSFSFTYNAAWGTGSKYILFQADGSSNVLEANENNNIAYRAINVQQPKPDLGFYQVVGSRNITAGNSTTISTKVHNRSTATAVGSSSQLRYWLSDDAVLNTATDRYLGSDTVGALAPNASEQESFTFTYNAAWGTGTKYFISQIDGTARVAESNESNNTYATRLSVTSPKPDLIINGTYGSSLVTTGQTVNVGAYTKNNSTLATAGNSQIRYWLSDDRTLNTATDRYLGFDSVAALGKGASEADSISFTYNASWGTGTKYILFQADGGSQVAESNENNNVAYRTLSVLPPKADLGFSYLSTPGSVAAGTTVNIASKVSNYSRDASVGATQIRYWLSDDISLNTSTDRYLGSDAVGSLAALASENDTFSFTYNTAWGTGTKYILFQADGLSQISESNENNNVAYRSIVVTPPKADLVVQNQSAPTSITVGSTVNVSASTRNIGQATSNIGFIRYWISDDTKLDIDTDLFVGQDNFGFLSPGASEYDSHSFFYDSVFGTGTKYILFDVDGYGATPESNENNNVAYEQITVRQPQADLIVQNQSAPSTIYAGDNVTVSAYTKNNTAFDVTSEYSYLRYWLSDDTKVDSQDRLLSNDFVTGLKKGSSEYDSHTFSYNLSWGTGRKYILFQADSTNRVSEGNENNNVAHRQIWVNAPKPDLIIQDTDVPTSAKTNKSVRIGVQTKNVGGGTANSSYVQYWLSDDASLNAASDRKLGQSYVGALSKNATHLDSFAFTYNEDWGIGTKYIFFQVDGGYGVSESNESNNIAYKTIFITASEAEAPETYKSFDVNKVFQLNSNISADHTIYLDFDGHTTSHTYWNTRYANGNSFDTAVYDIDGDASSFSLTEKENIWEIWQRVSEDFAPFDVNVTTVAPSSDRLKKTSSSDHQWGVRVAIGGGWDDWLGRNAGGIAMINSFYSNIDVPAFIFSENTANGQPKSVAEAVTHEVGHSLGLTHDGYDETGDGLLEDADGNLIDPLDEEYYSGHGSGVTGWSTIMGNSYKKELTQWSKGEYNKATEYQDDLSIITNSTNGFGYRTDDYGNSYTSAKALNPYSGSQVKAYGIIERNTDYDWFSFTSSTGRINLSIDAFNKGANLDILAELFDEFGRKVYVNGKAVVSNPIDTLGAVFNETLSAGKYYVRVTGTGKGDPKGDGYSDYGSLGQYSITGTIA